MPALVATLLSLCLVFSLSGRTVAADSPAAPPSPTDLSMTTAGTSTTLSTGSWTSSSSMVLRFMGQVTTGTLTPEVEIEPSGVAFTNSPNHSGTALTTSGAMQVRVDGLTNGTTYHWQARVTDTSGLSSTWVPFSAASDPKFDIGVDQTPPAKPVLTSQTNPIQSRWYHNRVVSLTWKAQDTFSGIKGYTYAVTRQWHGLKAGTIQPQTQLQVPNLSDGTWFIAVRAVDRAGNWGATAGYRVQLDRQAPRVTWLSPNRFSYNPYKGPISVRFSVDKDVSLSMDLFRVGDRTPTHTYVFRHLQAGRVATVSWSGKDDRGRLVPQGYYFFSVRAVDHADNVRQLNLGGIAVDPVKPASSPTGQVLYPGDGKRIIVSLSREMLYAYDGTHLLMQTYVTTGNPSLPTPEGSFTVLARYHPYEFISPWPAGSPYWYPPSWSEYAMLFRDGGYFLHDAPWRSVFGPGSNGPGQPGSNYGGTHGCINIPPGPMVFLWNWTPIGTPVLVVG